MLKLKAGKLKKKKASQNKRKWYLLHSKGKLRIPAFRHSKNRCTVLLFFNYKVVGRIFLIQHINCLQR